MACATSAAPTRPPHRCLLVCSVTGAGRPGPWVRRRHLPTPAGEHLCDLGMLRWLAEAEPQLRTITPGTSRPTRTGSGVNEALGYQVVATATGFQRHL